MNFFKSCLNLTLLSLLTCTGLAAPVLATADFDNSVRDADDEGNLNNPGVRTIKGDVTATDDLQDFRQVPSLVALTSASLVIARAEPICYYCADRVK